MLNAGALIEGAGFGQTGKEDWSVEIQRIGKTISKVLKRSDEERISTLQVARQMAVEMAEREAAL